MSNQIKFRAECLHDVRLLRRHYHAWHEAGPGASFTDWKIDVDKFGGAEVTITFDQGFTPETATKFVRAICAEIPDSHIIAETVAPAASYTGQRTYDYQSPA